MKKKNKHDELQSRREFFKKAATGALPIVAAIALSGMPSILKATEDTPMGCNIGCSNGCYTSCYTTCRIMCSGSCQGGCQGQCTGQCARSCSGTCRGSSTGFSW